MRTLITTILLLFSFGSAANNADDIQIKVTQVSGKVYMLTGAGGNIGVLATKEGLLLVDDQFAPLAEKIEAALKTIEDKPIQYIVNTHYHGDHTGGNAYFAHHAPIFAHENVRKRLAKKSDTEQGTLPVVTYENGVNIHLAGEKVELIHLSNGHTDGDSVVLFNNANVLHAGDLFFEGRFPYVDLDAGGTVNGYLENIEYLLDELPDDIKIIPGHGSLSDKEGLRAIADMIRFSIKFVEQSKLAGMSDEEILAQGLGPDYQHLSWNFITEEKWLKTLLKDMSAN